MTTIEINLAHAGVEWILEIDLSSGDDGPEIEGARVLRRIGCGALHEATEDAFAGWYSTTFGVSDLAATDSGETMFDRILRDELGDRIADEYRRERRAALEQGALMAVGL